MPESPRQAFFKSPHHAALALGTIGTGFATGQPLGLIAGAVAYVLGWLYLPDLGFFARWRERKAAEAIERERQAALGEFAIQRDALLGELTERRRARHEKFVQTCQQIAAAPAGFDPRSSKLEEMQWTYLRLLTIEQTLEIFLEGERRDGVPILLNEAQDEVAALEKEIARHPAGSGPPAREKLLESRRSRFEVLQQRAARIEEATANAQLSTAELERLEEQVKLIRADAVAAKNAGAMSERMDATFEHLAQTNRWLAEMDQFRDQLGELPEGGMGVISPLAATAQREAARQRNAPQREK
jgi:hypothetical protein